MVSANSSLDYDALGSTSGNFQGKFGSTDFSNLAELRSLTTQNHAVQIDLRVFAETIVQPADALTIFPHNDLRLGAASGAIDAGQVIGNINDGFDGAAPDAGAYELNGQLPVYGPRNCGLTAAREPTVRSR